MEKKYHQTIPTPKKKKKIDFKPKTIKPEDHYIMILGSNNQED